MYSNRTSNTQVTLESINALHKVTVIWIVAQMVKNPLCHAEDLGFEPKEDPCENGKGPLQYSGLSTWLDQGSIG